MSNRAIVLYRRVKHSGFWHENRIAAFFYPVLRFGIKALIAVRLTGRWGKQRVRVAHYYVRKWAKGQRKDDIRLRRARDAIQKKDWELAKKFYLAMLEAFKGRPLKLGVEIEIKMNLSLIDRLLGLQDYKKYIKAYNAAKKHPRIAVFSAISGGYENIKLPQVLNPAFDYFLYTDTPARGSDVFQIRPMPYFHEDATRRARYVKTHAHHLLPGYDYAIWVDANIMTLKDIMPLFEEFRRSKKPVAGIRHPLRSSIYEEVEECVKRSKDDTDLILAQAEHYKKLKFDCDDLVESGFMMFDLRNKKTSAFLDTWWAELDAYSRRDQLSLPYALHKNKIAWHSIMEKGFDVRNHPDFVLVPHSDPQTAVMELEKKLGSKAVDPFTGPSFYEKRKELLDNPLLDLDKKQIDIIYCVHNALEDVKICLASVAKHHTRNENLIIIDDGSEDDTKLFLEGFAKKHKDWARIIRTETGSGYTKAANRGLKASKGDLMILLNSDTIVTKDWAHKMALAVYGTPGAGIVGPMSSAASHQSIPNHESTVAGQTATNGLPKGLVAEDMNTYCEKWSVAGITPRVPLVHGFCYGVRREVIDKIGYFDEKNFPFGYGEENDYCFRAIDAGFGLVLATNTYIFHAKSKSYKNDARRTELMKNGSAALKSLRGEQRIRRAIITMQNNPVLIGLRSKTEDLYRKVQD